MSLASNGIEKYAYFIIVVFLSLFLFVSVSASVESQVTNTNSGLECEVQEGVGCDNESMEPVLSMFDDVNSHVGLPGYYDDYTLCCEQDVHSGNLITSTVLDNSTDNLDEQLSKRSILSLYQENNTHVEVTELDNLDYETYMFPYTECSLEEDTYDPDENEECVLRLYNESDSHVESCDTENFDYTLYCEIPDPDVNREACEWMDGFEHDGKTYSYRWNDTNIEYEDPMSDPNCCGDDWGFDYYANGERVSERETVRQGERGIYFDTSEAPDDDYDDWACCNGTDYQGDFNEGCSFENRCYNHCDEEDVTGDDYEEICYDGEWRLGDEMYQLMIDGDMIDWETAEIVEGADVTAQLVYRNQILDDETIEDFDGDRFMIELQHPLEEGNIYTIRIISEKEVDGVYETSSLEKDFVFHGGHGEHVEEC